LFNSLRANYFPNLDFWSRIVSMYAVIWTKRSCYLRPFAKILLAMAALHEKKPEVVRAQLRYLVAEFPDNPLFTR